MRLFKTTLFLLWTLNSLGQTRDIITKQQALEDFKIFETTLREIHPNVYRYTSKSEFDKTFEKVKNSLSETISVRQFYNLVAPIMAMVHCGHTFGITSFEDDKRGLLPLEVKILNDKIYVLRNLSSSEDLRAGSEILSINGVTAFDILQDFRNKSIADGYGLNFKDRTIERDFKWKFATFINQPDSFKIELKDYRTEVRKNITIASLPNETITERLKKLELPVEKPLSFVIDKNNNVAILKLSSFMATSLKKQSGQNLRKTIKSSFNELNRMKVNNLIIDIRGNTGGKVFATPLLFSYLTDKDFKVGYKILFRHGYKFSYPEYLNRNKFNDWVNGKLDRKINDSTYEWTLHKITRKTFKMKRKPYRGKVYIVTNGMTASAGAEFASLVRAHGKGIFVGEETGGDFNGVNGFDRTYLLLPNSGIGLLIAGWRGVMAWPENKNIGRGVPPDFEVHPTLEDLLTGQDAEMKLIYGLIKSK